MLQFFPHAEGYLKLTGNINSVNDEVVFIDYIYQYKDHLGNIRLNYLNEKGTLKILEEDHYYPFGLKHTYNFSKMAPILEEFAGVMTKRIVQVPNSGYQYKFQGQELQDELGLNWYSFKWRNYDPAIGRFMSIDPLSEKYAYQSHYNFSENRVIDGFELEGLEVVLINPTKSASTEQQKAADKRIESGAMNIPNSSTLITVTGHGSPRGMSNDVRGEKIRTASQLNAVLNRNSDDWKNKESGEGMTVVLYSCRTGSDVKDKDLNSIAPSFAQTISGYDEFKDVEIIAPDQRVYFHRRWTNRNI